MILSLKTQSIDIDSKSLEYIFDFSNLELSIYELFSNKNKKIVGKFKVETPKNI